MRRAHKPWRGYWDVPGGFCEPDEHPIDTATREVLEETGLSVDVVGFLGIWMDEYGDDEATTKKTLNIYYHAVPHAGAPVGIADPHEVSEMAWFALHELPSTGELAFPEHVVPVLDAWRLAIRQGQVTSALPDRPDRIT